MNRVSGISSTKKEIKHFAVIFQPNRTILFFFLQGFIVNNMSHCLETKIQLTANLSWLFMNGNMEERTTNIPE